MVLNKALMHAFTLWTQAPLRPASPVKISFKVKTQAHRPQKKPTQALKPANKWLSPPKPGGHITRVPRNQFQRMPELMSG